MPSVLTRVKELKRNFYDNAPSQNRPKIEKVLEMYKDKSNMNFTVVQNMVLALYSPTLMGKKNVDKMYENFLSKYGNEEAFPMDYTRGMTNKEKLQERRDRILGRKQSYQLFVAIYTQEKRMDPQKREEYLAATEKQPKDARSKEGTGLGPDHLPQHHGAGLQLPCLRGAPLEAGTEGHQGVQTALPNMHDGQGLRRARQEGPRLR